MRKINYETSSPAYAAVRDSENISTPFWEIKKLFTILNRIGKRHAACINFIRISTFFWSMKDLKLEI